MRNIGITLFITLTAISSYNCGGFVDKVKSMLFLNGTYLQSDESRLAELKAKFFSKTEGKFLHNEVVSRMFEDKQSFKMVYILYFNSLALAFQHDCIPMMNSYDCSVIMDHMELVLYYYIKEQDLQIDELRNPNSQIVDEDELFNKYLEMNDPETLFQRFMQVPAEDSEIYRDNDEFYSEVAPILEKFNQKLKDDKMTEKYADILQRCKIQLQKATEIIFTSENLDRREVE